MRLIDADALMKELSTLFIQPKDSEDYMNVGYDHAIADAVITVHEHPTADVVERKRGKWISRKNEPKHKNWWTCSKCQGQFDYQWKFCPNCGAEMEGEEDA